MWKWTTPLLAAVLLLAGCSSSSGDSNPSIPVPSSSGPVAPTVQDASTAVDPPAADTKAPTPAAPKPSNIVDKYDTATCADWAVTHAANRAIVATYFAVKYAPKLKLPGGTEGVLRESITTACGTDGVPLRATVREVAVASLKLLEQSSS